MFPLAGGVDGPQDLRPLVATVLDALAKGAADRGGPIPAGTPSELDSRVLAALGDVVPATGTGAAEALTTIVELLAFGAADPADPACAAHLHCPPLAVAVAADLAVSTVNQSLDSWDQSPAATAMEPVVMRGLATLVGLPDTADGVMTTGGTESNLMGLLFARDRAVQARWGVSATRVGVPDGARPRVFCSTAAHFSVARNAGLIGLGEDSVVAVATDDGQRMRPDALLAAVEAASAAGELPVAVVATAGTTDVGAIDPLPEIAAIAERTGLWFHVDAAFGGGALFSSRLRGLLTGIDLADSVGLDLHKLGWLPVPAGVFLARDAATFGVIDRQAAYLTTDDDVDAGYPSLLGRSLRTTRRPDVVKLAVTLRAVGVAGLGAMVERCCDLARFAAAEIGRRPRLRLYREPTLTTVLFRHDGTNEHNTELRRVLFRAGSAVVGRTEFDGTVWLKLTLLNPHTTEADIVAILALVEAAGA